jgi:hypothetical protein
VPQDPLITAGLPPPASESARAEPKQSSATAEIPEHAKEHDPMLDIHPAHHAATTWRDFLVHIATIVLGLLIAIGLEQSVELLHHRNQRQQLQEDLRNEAAQNLQVIDRDLKMQYLEPWFQQAITAASAAVPYRIRITLPPAPCLPGSVGTAEYRYFAPSQAVWTTAKESGVVAFLPPPESRMYARLAHNYDLLESQRDQVFNDCQTITAMRLRFAQRADASGASEVWTMTPDQAERLATTAADTKIAIQGLLFRLRWSRVYEQGILDGQTAADIKMMTINQERFEDPLLEPEAQKPGKITPSSARPPAAHETPAPTKQTPPPAKIPPNNDPVP